MVHLLPDSGRGTVSRGDVASALERLDAPPDSLDRTISHLSRAGVEVAEPEETPVFLDQGRRSGSDLVRMYLREIGRVPLLTARTR